MIKVLRLTKQYLTISIKEQTQFAFDFVLNIVQFLFYTALTIIFWGTLMRFTYMFVDWKLGELIVLNGVSIIATGLSLLFFGFNRVDIYLQRGELDHLLCRPVPLLLGILGKGIETVGAIQQIFSGLLIIAVGTLSYKIHLSFPNIVYAVIVLGIGAVSINLARGCLSLLSIFVGRTMPIVDFLFRLDDFQKYPLDTFPKSIQTVFTWLLPIMYVSTYPTMILVGKRLPDNLLFMLITIILGWILLVWFIQRKALRHYESRGG